MPNIYKRGKIESQARWIFTRAMNLIQVYESKGDLTENDYKELTKIVDDYCEQAKHNRFCQEVMLCVLQAFEEEEKVKKSKKNAEDEKNEQ